MKVERTANPISVTVKIDWKLGADENKAIANISELQRRSAEYWTGIDDERQLAISIAVQDVLAQLIVNPREWLPLAARAEPGILEVGIAIAMSDMDEGILKLRVAAERQLSEARDAMVSMRRDLDE